MIRQRTSVGLDVHARSVVACGLDRDTGEVIEQRLTPDHRDILGWIEGLPGPVAVTYEAGPTGFTLARGFGIGRNLVPGRCAVEVDPSSRRSSQDR